jgi:hypothetical protein
MVEEMGVWGKGGRTSIEIQICICKMYGEFQIRARATSQNTHLSRKLLVKKKKPPQKNKAGMVVSGWCQFRREMAVRK